MCFSPTVSFFLALVGTVIAGYHHRQERKGLRDVLLFYTIMELLQGVQYLLLPGVGCSTLNVFSTYLAHLLIVAQPALWNLYRYRAFSQNKPIFLFAYHCSLLWAFCFTLRLFAFPSTHLAPSLHSHEILVGPLVCTQAGPTHLYWTLPYYSYSGLEPNLFTYLLLWFLPTYYESQGGWKLLSWLVQISLIQFLVGYYQELPSYWCALSIPFLLASLRQKDKSPSLLSW